MNHNGEPVGETGIRGLPATWAVVVQLVGTFGLAVFLVLYYVLVMQPRAETRYDELRVSVNRLIEVVEEGQTLVTREQGDRLEELYILAVAPELADRIERILPEGQVSAAEAGPLKQELGTNLQDVMLVRTRLLRGLSLQDEGDISQQLSEKIRDRQIPAQLAQRAVVEWPYESQQELLSTCRESLYFAFRRAEIAK